MRNKAWIKCQYMMSYSKIINKLMWMWQITNCHKTIKWMIARRHSTNCQWMNLWMINNSSYISFLLMINRRTCKHQEVTNYRKMTIMFSRDRLAMNYRKMIIKTIPTCQSMNCPLMKMKFKKNPSNINSLNKWPIQLRQMIRLVIFIIQQLKRFRKVQAPKLKCELHWIKSKRNWREKAWKNSYKWKITVSNIPTSIQPWIIHSKRQTRRV